MNASMKSAEFQSEVTGLVVGQEIPSIEQDLFSLAAIAPSVLENIPGMFEETVKESLTYLRGTNEAKGVLEWFRGDELTSRAGVFARLATVYGERASPIQMLIDRAFGIRVHRLLNELA